MSKFILIAYQKEHSVDTKYTDLYFKVNLSDRTDPTRYLEIKDGVVNYFNQNETIQYDGEWKCSVLVGRKDGDRITTLAVAIEQDNRECIVVAEVEKATYELILEHKDEEE